MIRTIHQSRKLFLSLVVAVLVLAAYVPAFGQGPGDLLVAPTRVVLTDRHRTGELLLMNSGTTTATYRITFTHLRMSETGGMQEISTPAADEFFCDDIVRFSPRQVTLEPKGSQTVRLQLRLPSDLAEGEYRSHLQFKAIPQTPPAEAAEQKDEPPTEVKVRLTATFGVSIPVIVRHGRTAAEATVSDVAVVPAASPDEPMLLTATLNRTGNQSIYGDLTATFTTGKARPVTVATIGGVAVYTPNPKRIVKMELKPPAGVDLKAGRITLTYREKPSDGGKVIAEGSVDIP